MNFVFTCLKPFFFALSVTPANPGLHARRFKSSVFVSFFRFVNLAFFEIFWVAAYNAPKRRRSPSRALPGSTFVDFSLIWCRFWMPKRYQNHLGFNVNALAQPCERCFFMTAPSINHTFGSS